MVNNTERSPKKEKVSTEKSDSEKKNVDYQKIHTFNIMSIYLILL